MPADLHFIRPLWLLGWVPLAAAVWIIHRAGALSPAWSRIIAPRLLDHLAVNRAEKRRATPAMVLLLGGAVGIVALAGPTWMPEENPTAPKDAALMVVMEVSKSMDGTDVGPSRIARAKFKVRDLIDTGQVGRLGLIAYAGTPHLVMPLTNDQEIIVPYLDALSSDVMPVPGERADKVVPLVAKIEADLNNTPLSVLLVSDGLSPAEATAWTTLCSKAGIHLSVLAVGTRAGVPAQQVPPLAMDGFDTLARNVDATVVSLAAGGADVRHIVHTVQRYHRSTTGKGDTVIWKDMGYYLVFPFALVVLFWFRRGWVIHVASTAIIVTLTGCGDATFMDLWLTRDQQGQRLFDAGQYQAAGERFADPMRKGLASYAAENWDKAIKSFAEVDTPEGDFNRGNAHAQKGELITAVRMYDKALERRPLYREARANRDLFKRYLESLTESNDAEEVANGPVAPSDEAAVKLSDEQKSGGAASQSPFDKIDKSADEMDAPLSKEMDATWMRRVTTRPADFLRAKFAAQRNGGDR